MPTDEAVEAKVAHKTLIRLANSCEREAARGKIVVRFGSDLNEEDLRAIADILRRLAATLDDETG